jgi:hypothetical protein
MSVTKVDYKKVLELSEELLECAECNYGLDEESPKCENCHEIDLILRSWGY